ncbi:MAG TPA: endopeptidase La [Polyangia bacterium]|nr:endopeptidase La [Polyangia bacterium]
MSVSEYLPDGSIKRTLDVPDILAVLPVRDLVVFPYMMVPLMCSRELSTAAIEQALETADRLVLLCAQRDEADETPSADGLHPVGTIGMIVRMRKLSDGRVKVLVQGLMRARVTGIEAEAPCFRASIARLDDAGEPTGGYESEALIRAVKDDLQKYGESGKALSQELLVILNGIDEPGRLADLVASNLTMKVDVGQPLLEELRPLERLRRVSVLLRKEVEILEVQATIQSRAKEEMSKAQREYFLREQLRQIQSELGGGGPSGRGEMDSLRARIDSARMPDEARLEADRQLRRLEQTQADSIEAGVIRAYLEWLVEVPWDRSTDDNLDLEAARLILDEDHYGLEDVKDRLLEHLGVLKLTRERAGHARHAGPILCFVGPPGVGKTSLGRSIARALGRRFVRMSLGGVRDEAEIRGHRRTYVGALPGRVVQSMKQAGTINPVMVLDEIDKLGADFRGDPSAALLEVLDHEQNSSFRDHYLGVAYDLSQVLFIATANATDPIPRALGDRMEIIRLAGYDEDEKLEIARRHVVPRQLEACGLDAEALQFSQPALRAIVSDYTREAGLRDLERQVAAICRKVARRVVEEREAGRAPHATTITPAMLRKYLGAPHPRLAQAAEMDEVGAATGLAWTPFGGEVLRVEAQWMPGKGSLILTGQLGEVMKESAMTALSYARARAASLGLKAGFYAEREIHIHVPAGAVPKDGPSAGVTMACALVSLLTGQAVKRQVAMTGEITLRGRVLPVGGLKEKLLAAARAGMECVILPSENARDVESLPKKSLRGMRVVLARTMDDVLAAALQPSGKPLRARTRGHRVDA